MTTTEIREALTEVQHAVEVPAVDQLAFRARVRAERRRRNAGRGLAVAGTAAAAVAVIAALPLSGGRQASSPGPQTATSPTANLDGGTPSKMGLALLSERGRLMVLQPGGGAYRDPQVRVEEVLGRSPGGVVLVDGESRVVFRPLDEDGAIGAARPLAGGDPVQRAWLDKTGGTLAFVDLDNVLHIRPIGSERDTESVPLLDQQTSLVATDGTRWIEDEGDRLSLRLPDESFEVVPGGDPFEAELGGDTLAVHTDDGVHFFDDTDGTPRLVEARGWIGSLSPDGSMYAADPSAREEYAGPQSTLFVMDTHTGNQERLAGYGADMRALDLSWQDDDRFLVLAESTERPGNHVLFDCSVALGRCDERYDDPTGTMTIPSQ